MRIKCWGWIQRHPGSRWRPRAMGIRQRRALASRFRQLVEHAAKLAYMRGQTLAENRRGWEQTVREQRRALASLMAANPGLMNLMDDAFLQRLYVRLVSELRAEYAQVDFPEECPFGWEELLG